MKLRSPEFGNVFSVETNALVVKSLDGNTIFIHDPSWPKVDGFKVRFRALSEEVKTALIDFLRGTAGQEIEYTDHEERRWLGIISTPEPELVQYGRGCQWEVELQFEGARQA